MSPAQPSAEFIPSQEPERELPELRLIQDNYEEAGPDDVERPDLYVVPDSADQTALEAEPEAIAENGNISVEAPTPRQRAAKQVSRLLGIMHRGKTSRLSGAELGDNADDDHRHRGGGGGWAIREYLRKMKAKAEAMEHRSSCSGCQDCETAWVY